MGLDCQRYRDLKPRLRVRGLWILGTEPVADTVWHGFHHRLPNIFFNAAIPEFHNVTHEAATLQKQESGRPTTTRRISRAVAHVLAFGI